MVKMVIFKERSYKSGKDSFLSKVFQTQLCLWANTKSKQTHSFCSKSTIIHKYTQ